MSLFNQTTFNEFVICNNVLSIFHEPILLKSGTSSHLYINWRQSTNSPALLDKISDFLLDFCYDHGLKPECFFGVPEGATKLGIIASFKLASQRFKLAPDQGFIPMGRGKIKEHGEEKDRYYLGMPQNRPTIVIEDVTTTGGSLIACVDRLLGDGVPVIAALALTNRMANGDDITHEFRKRYGVSCPFYALTSLGSLLDHWRQKETLTQCQRHTLLHEFPEMFLEDKGGI